MKNNNQKPRLCLGSAQFGMNYGITNKHGRVKNEYLKKIIEKAEENNIFLIDTAQSYGNAEKNLGKYISQKSTIINKMKAHNGACITDKDEQEWRNSFQESCDNLKVKNIDTLLVHNSGDLKKKGNRYLYRFLDNLKREGLVNKIGVSIYEETELDGIRLENIDVVQVPISLYDQRIIKCGAIEKLKMSGIEVHGRSLYLQGLLLEKTENWPKWIEEQSRIIHKDLIKTAKSKGCDLIDLVLGFAKSLSSFEVIMIGICSVEQLVELISIWEKQSPWEEEEWEKWSLNDELLIDPRKWP